MTLLHISLSSLRPRGTSKHTLSTFTVSHLFQVHFSFFTIDRNYPFHQYDFLNIFRSEYFCFLHPWHADTFWVFLFPSSWHVLSIPVFIIHKTQSLSLHNFPQSFSSGVISPFIDWSWLSLALLSLSFSLSFYSVSFIPEALLTNTPQTLSQVIHFERRFPLRTSAWFTLPVSPFL